jgi:hypothetical protein
VLSRGASELRHIGVDSFMMLLLVNSERSSSYQGKPHAAV